MIGACRHGYEAASNHIGEVLAVDAGREGDREAVAEVLADLFFDLPGEVVAAVDHREDDGFERELRIEAGANEIHGDLAGLGAGGGVARLIQERFLPTGVPDVPGWRIAAYYRPAREVGGLLVLTHAAEKAPHLRRKDRRAFCAPMATINPPPVPNPCKNGTIIFFPFSVMCSHRER